MLDLGDVAFDWGTIFIQLIVMLPVILFYVFIIYFLFKALAFMKAKIKLDQERNRHLEQLIAETRSRKLE